jgi:two-component system, cell cycle response regulator DivK
MDSCTRLRAPLVLLVDDSGDLRSMYTEYLGGAGFRVETAGNGNEAVALTLALVPNIILMDLDLPDLDGWEAARLIRSYRRTRSIPMVALSGLYDTTSVTRAMSAGCDRFLAKPCMPSDLERVIRLTMREKNEEHARLLPR